jgi:hypothetical protein
MRRQDSTWWGRNTRLGIYLLVKRSFLGAQRNLIFRLTERCDREIGSSRHGRFAFMKDRLEVLAKALKPFEERCPRIQPRGRGDSLYYLMPDERRKIQIKRPAKPRYPLDVFTFIPFPQNRRKDLFGTCFQILFPAALAQQPLLRPQISTATRELRGSSSRFIPRSRPTKPGRILAAKGHHLG